MRHHTHAGFDMPADPMGRPVDTALIGQFIAAAYDGCGPCQDDLLNRVAADAPTTARLVEICCVAVHYELDGVPGVLTSPDPDVRRASAEFAQLARAGIDGNNERMFDACAMLSDAQRRAAADSAADLLVGLL